MKIHNTMTRRLESFKPLESDHVGMYTCGPTVYNYAHIGNFRAYVWEDLLRRTLKLLGYRVTQVMNITDIEDKIIARMQEEGCSLDEVTGPNIEAFFRDIDTLRIERAEHYPRATDHIPEMLDLAAGLKEKGHTYASQGSLYFSIGSFEEYGRLSHLDKREIRDGARIDSDEYEKENARDFVLWKGFREGEVGVFNKTAEKKIGLNSEPITVIIRCYGRELPPDKTVGGVNVRYARHDERAKQ